MKKLALALASAACVCLAAAPVSAAEVEMTRHDFDMLISWSYRCGMIEEAMAIYGGLKAGNNPTLDQIRIQAHIARLTGPMTECAKVRADARRMRATDDLGGP